MIHFIFRWPPGRGSGWYIAGCVGWPAPFLYRRGRLPPLLGRHTLFYGGPAGGSEQRAAAARPHRPAPTQPSPASPPATLLASHRRLSPKRRRRRRGAAQLVRPVTHQLSCVPGRVRQQACLAAVRATAACRRCANIAGSPPPPPLLLGITRRAS